MNHGLKTVAETNALITSGRALLVAGAQPLLEQLEPGRWIGGTIPYFMGQDGGVETDTLLFVTELGPRFVSVELASYGADELSRIPRDYPQHGVSFIIVPAGCEAHARFARDGGSYPGFFERPLVGWVAGTSLSRIGLDAPRVFDGSRRTSWADRAIVLHASLRPDVVVRTDIINLFHPAPDSPVLTFDDEGFSVTWCRVNGERRRLAEVLATRGQPLDAPLVADWSGAHLNVSLQRVDAATGRVDFYAPVFKGVEYRFPLVPADYERAFRDELERRRIEPLFACNCVLNYLAAGLAGRRSGALQGPFTFGEIAWMLLNQTAVYVTLESRPEAAALPHG
ncbi:MAG: DUF6976 family protein [Myxococcota bacterium]